MSDSSLLTVVYWRSKSSPDIVWIRLWPRERLFIYITKQRNRGRAPVIDLFTFGSVRQSDVMHCRSHSSVTTVALWKKNSKIIKGWAVAYAVAAEGHVCQFRVVWSVWKGWDLQLSEGEICSAVCRRARRAHLKVGRTWAMMEGIRKKGPVLGLIKLNISRDILSVLHVGQKCRGTLESFPVNS